MKKYLLGTLLVCSMGLAACTSNNDEEVSAQSKEQSTTETTEEEDPEATFEDGVFENDDFKITYKEAKIIQSPMESNPGLYTTFELENKSDENITPQDVLEEYIIMNQENDTSEVELDNRYHSLDAFGPEEDTESYSEQVDIDNKLLNDLKPDKQDEYVISYELDNKKEPVNMQTMVDSEYGEYSDPYEIKLDDLEEIPEPEGEEDAAMEEEPEPETEEYEEPEFNENTEQEETFVPEEPGVDSAIAQRYQDAIENQGMSEDEAYDYANAPYIDEDAEEELEDGEYYDYEDDFEDEISEEDAEANIEQVEQFRKDFKAENGREPTSGEIQSQW